MAASFSGGMPHRPSPCGCRVPPISPSPPLTYAMKALRSSASESARRMSGLLKGAALRLTSRLVLLFIDPVSHTTLDDGRLDSRSCGIVTSQGKVMSKRPARKLSSAVWELLMMVNSMPSR